MPDEFDLKKMKINPDRPVNIDSYRKLVRSYIDLHLYSSALFWADKVVSLSEGEPEDVYWLAQCMFLLKQYHRAAILLKNKAFLKTHLICRYLAAKCLLEAKEFQEALELLSEVDMGGWDGAKETPVSGGCAGVSGSFLSGGQQPLNTGAIKGLPSPSLASSVLYLKGCVYEALDNRSLASECYRQALKQDVFCFDAFQALVQHQMLSAAEEAELLASLPIAEQCKSKDDEWLVRSLYESLLKKYHSVPPRSVVQIHPRLQGNLDLRAAEAERCHYACNYTQCLRITSEILEEDPYHLSCLPIHIAVLVKLKKTSELFYLAHNLVDIRPDMAVSWFAVGCYYILKGKTDPARRYLGKATALDRLFGPAWLAYGHSFAVENEHDQAMAAYFKASQLMKGCHLPLLYIGLECGLTNNNKLAEKFFSQAEAIAPDDPFVLHEMGVIAFQNNDFVEAEKYFEEALERVRNINEPLIADNWEALFNNLGHTCRKLKKYHKAIQYHQQALILSPAEASTLAAIGFVEALLGESERAAQSFHKALGIRRDDTFSTTMLSSVLEQLAAVSPPFLGEEAPGLGSPLLLSRTGNRKQSEDSEDLPETPVNVSAPAPAANTTPPRSAHLMDMIDSFQDENNT